MWHQASLPCQQMAWAVPFNPMSLGKVAARMGSSTPHFASVTLGYLGLISETWRFSSFFLIFPHFSSFFLIFPHFSSFFPSFPVFFRFSMAIRPQVSNAQKGSVPFQYTIGLVHPFYTKTRLTRYLCNQISQNRTKKYQIWPCEIIRFLKIVKFLVLQTKKKDPFHTKKRG